MKKLSRYAAWCCSVDQGFAAAFVGGMHKGGRRLKAKTALMHFLIEFTGN
jgi:hypothetical protein